MAHGHKFDVKKLERLRDPERLKYLNPDKIWEAVAPAGVSTIVDIGAGIGFLAIPFARKISAGTVYACDLKEEMLDHLKAAVAAEGVDNVVAVKTEEVRVPLEDGVADLVLMVNLHHELDHPEKSLAECHRLLRKGGRLAIVDWEPKDSPSGPPVHVRLPAAEVMRQAAEAGFEEVRQTLSLLPYHYVITSQKPA